MNRKKSPRVSDCHTWSLRGCKKRPLIFLYFAGKTGMLWCHSSGRGNVASIGSVYPLPYFALQNSLLGSVPNPQNGKESKTNGRQKTNRAGQILCDGRRTEVDSRKNEIDTNPEYGRLSAKDGDRWLCCPHRHHRHPGADRRTAKDWCQY